MLSLIILALLTLAVTSCDITTKRGNEDKDFSVLDNPNLQIATFAGGCFWCVESAFEAYDGVQEVFSGYTGGEEVNPAYKEVASGETGHREAVQIYFDPTMISYNDLLEIFWRQIDPTDAEGSFVDKGQQYTSAIYYHNDEQKELAEQSKANLEKSQKYSAPIVTEILPAGPFYLAEEYHQDYHTKNPLRYNYYRGNSGRDQYREEVWGEDKDFVVNN